MNRAQTELLELYLRGELTDAEAAAVEHAISADPAWGALVDQLAAASDLAARGAAAEAPSQTGGGHAALSILAARASRRFYGAGALALVLVLGLVGLWTQTRRDAGPSNQFADQLCLLAHRGDPLPLRPSLDCGLDPDAYLGGGRSVEATEIRIQLDRDPRPQDPDWVRTRALVGLLERRPSEVIALLEDSPVLLQEPALHADLAAAWLLQGDRARARAVLEEGLALAPGHPLLRANLGELDR